MVPFELKDNSGQTISQTTINIQLFRMVVIP